MVPFEFLFVDKEYVRECQDARLAYLHAIAKVGGQNHDRRVGDRRHLELRLADPDGFEDHRVEAERAEQPDALASGQGKTAEVAPRSHAANEDLGIERVTLHADAVAEDRATGEW